MACLKLVNKKVRFIYPLLWRLYKLVSVLKVQQFAVICDSYPWCCELAIKKSSFSLRLEVTHGIWRDRKDNEEAFLLWPMVSKAATVPETWASASANAACSSFHFVISPKELLTSIPAKKKTSMVLCNRLKQSLTGVVCHRNRQTYISLLRTSNLGISCDKIMLEFWPTEPIYATEMIHITV